MEKFQIELVVELIDKDLQWSEKSLRRYKNTSTNVQDVLFYKHRIEALEARIRDFKVIRNILIYGE